MTKTKTERRIAAQISDAELYKITHNTTQAIAAERRHDELDRLREAREQKKTWLKTVGFCLALNLTFLTLGLVGLAIQ